MKEIPKPGDVVEIHLAGFKESVFCLAPKNGPWDHRFASARYIILLDNRPIDKWKRFVPGQVVFSQDQYVKRIVPEPETSYMKILAMIEGG
jgi:hypothetical protein